MPSNQTARTNNPPISRPYSPATHQLANRSNLTTGSATQTLTNTPNRSESPDPLVLRLRGAHSPRPATVDSTASSDETSTRRRARIQWAEDVVDNEGLGRKKSKVCCIYHKPRAAGESSDESSSDSSSSGSDSDNGDGARPVNGRKGRGRHGDGHGHKDGDECGHDHGKHQKKPRRRPSPNAYEKMPKYDVKPLTHPPGSGS